MAKAIHGNENPAHGCATLHVQSSKSVPQNLLDGQQGARDGRVRRVEHVREHADRGQHAELHGVQRRARLRRAPSRTHAPDLAVLLAATSRLARPTEALAAPNRFGHRKPTPLIDSAKASADAGHRQRVPHGPRAGPVAEAPVHRRRRPGRARIDQATPCCRRRGGGAPREGGFRVPWIRSSLLDERLLRSDKSFAGASSTTREAWRH